LLKKGFSLATVSMPITLYSLFFIQFFLPILKSMQNFISIIFLLSGMGPDFRVLVRKSRKQAEQYHRLYKVCIFFLNYFLFQYFYN
jgi:hypothetical protein